ncbi:MAG TPA: alanine--glyoxylate aminotransferase family protein [Methanotrichaceae archaeon]|nr:alanine--glyoxylate aminotransferase family protein [Methanotrichaceae archaeon]
MDTEDILLMIPGPVKVAPRVLRAMSRPMISHRSGDFSAIYSDCRNLLKEFFKTNNEIVAMTGSGTCGMDAAVGSIVKPGEKIVTISNGKFGERFTEIGDRYGQVVPVKFEWGKPFDLEKIEAALQGGAKAVAMVHNETSVGLVNPAKEVGELAHKYGAIFIVDGISSIGGNEFLTDDWGVDIAITGSQKCLAVPPGLALVAMSDNAIGNLKDKASSYYADLRAHLKSARKSSPETPFTPAVPLFFALQEALHMASEEGFDARRARTARLAEAVRAAAGALGLELFPEVDERSYYSNTVTAMKMPKGITDEKLRGGMKKQGVVVSGGQNQLKGKIFRIGSMGVCSQGDTLRTIQTLELVMAREGLIARTGEGIEAASKVLGL